MVERTESLNLGEILLKEGLISHEHLDEAREKRKTTDKSIGQILVDMGVISESVKMNFLRKKFGYDFFALDQSQIDPGILEFIPKPYAQKYHIVPVEIREGSLVIAMDDPSDISMLDNLKSIVGMPVKPVIANSSDIDQVLKEYPETREEIDLEYKKPSLIYRIVKYAAFPVLGFLPLLVFIALLNFSESFVDRVTMITQAGSSFNFDVFLYTLCGWGLWIIIMWEINGLIFHSEEEAQAAAESEESME